MYQVRIAAAAVVAMLATPLAAQGDGREAPAQDAAGQNTGGQNANPFKPFDRAAFEQHARTLGADDARIAAFEADVDAITPARASEALLRELVPAFHAAMGAAENADPRAAILLAELVGDEDRYVRAHARYWLGRTFLDANDPERSIEVLGEFLQRDRNVTALDSEAAFFYATSLADLPKPALAAAAFHDYLRLFPDAPERYRTVADQRRATLLSQLDNPLHEIADVMKGVERDIGKGRTGKPVQTEQLKIVENLQKIIEQLEEQEKRSSGSPSGNQQSQAPASESSLPGGAARVGSLDNVPQVVERWGRLNDKERDEIATEVQARLSGRYLELLEGYYRTLSRKRP